MKWRDIPSSKTLRRLIQQQLEQILPSVHGYSLVTLGELSAAFDYKSAAVANVIRINASQQVDVCADLQQLPLGSDDVDAIFMPLLIEQSQQPHQLLREVARSLRPGGKLILVVFNPFSIWGLYKLVLGRSGCQPWCNAFYRLGRLEDWISLLGLELIFKHGFFTQWPGVKNQVKMQSIPAVAHCRFGAMYFLVAEKKIKTLTPIRPVWKKTRVIHSKMIEPTRKSIQ